MWALTKFCEWRLFTARTAIYFLVGGCGLLLLGPPALTQCLLPSTTAA
jgi:hypothetical protein